MKRLSILLLCAAMSCHVFSARRALVIGIGRYPQVDGGWHIIDGDKDISLIVATLAANGFAEYDIATLRNADATYANIVRAFENLAAQCLPGDTVVVHFSGHGQQVTDLDGDEPDGYDEAWVPYDALQIITDDYHGERHITDDMLNAWLTAIYHRVGAQGHIVVWADACHSGDSTRGTEELAETRGSAACLQMQGDRQPFSQQRPMSWLLLSACGIDECNRQVVLDNGTQCGALTYALYTLRGDISRYTAEQLAREIAGLINRKAARKQTPKLQAPKSKLKTRML